MCIYRGGLPSNERFLSQYVRMIPGVPKYGQSIDILETKRRKRNMMDVIMIVVLLGSFLLVKLFADFCESQVEPKEE